MRRYVIGYYNKQATKEDFVILATTDSTVVLSFLQQSYNKAYKENGVSTRAVALRYDEVPQEHRWAI